MANATDSRRMLYENLTDAGCDSKLTKRLMGLLTAGHINEGMSLLAKHREAVLESCNA